jgi:hypothetical protein
MVIGLPPLDFIDQHQLIPLHNIMKKCTIARRYKCPEFGDLAPAIYDFNQPRPQKRGQTGTKGDDTSQMNMD